MFITKELTLNDIHADLLKNFDRYQETKRCWRNKQGKWTLTDDSFTEVWTDETKKDIIANDFAKSIGTNGIVFGIFDDENHLIAFARLLTSFFGSENQYLQLIQIHDSKELRNKGYGKSLFDLCSAKAKQLGAKKLYIGAHPAEETQGFYKSLGCVDAKEINREIYEHEPLDRQLEFLL